MKYFFAIFIAALVIIYYASAPKAEQMYTNADVYQALHPVPKPQGQGHYEVKFKVPASYGRKTSSKLVVESWIGNDKEGYYETDEAGNISTSHWKQSIMGVSA